MGLFDNLKKIFYDEVTVDVPSEEERETVVSKPKIEEIKTTHEEVKKSESTSNSFNERELFKTETSFKFPLIDEDDEEEEDTILTRSRTNNYRPIDEDFNINTSYNKPNYVEPSPRENRSYSYNTVNNIKVNKSESAPKKFEPTPIISPVYGVLDKNYNKEDVVTKAEPSMPPNGHGFNYDYVRRKAYGTLEDELENSIINIEEDVTQNKANIDKIINDDEEDGSKSIEDLLSEIEENANISIGDLEEKIKDKNEKLEEEEEDNINNILNDSLMDDIKEEIKENNASLYNDIVNKNDDKDNSLASQLEDELSIDNSDKSLETDLFNLIDSMYEEKDGE